MEESELELYNESRQSILLGVTHPLHPLIQERVQESGESVESNADRDTIGSEEGTKVAMKEIFNLVI